MISCLRGWKLLVTLHVLLFRNSPRLEAPAETADTAVRAYVDGKPVKSYVNE